MANANRDIPWLLGLEATLSFSVSVWAPAAWGRPATHPVEFFVVLLSVATTCAVVFHVAPACFAARCARLGPRSAWALVPIAAGYIVCTARLLLAMHRQLASLQLGLSPVTLAVFVLLLIPLAFVRSCWKSAIILALLIGGGVSMYMLATPWHGIWTANSSFAREPVPDSGYLAEGLFVAIAPVVGVAWRIGCLETRQNRIWFSAFLGVFLPLLLSTSIAALMAQAGENLFWRPSLFLEFSWALLGRQGVHNATAWRAIYALVALSLFGPALLAALSVRWLAAAFDKARNLTLAFASAVAIAWLLVNRRDLSFYPPYDLALSLWTLLLSVLGITGGLACLFRRSGEPTVSNIQQRRRRILLMLAVNALGVVGYLVVASPSWAIPEERNAGIYSITGDPFLWFLSVWPILTLFVLLNLSWAAFILAKRRWLEGRFWLIAPLIWLVAVSIDFAQH